MADKKTYGNRQELIIKNLTSITQAIPLMDEKIMGFQRRELGMDLPYVMGEKPQSQGPPTNVFDAIDQEVDKLRLAMNKLANRVDQMVNSINPTAHCDNY